MRKKHYYPLWYGFIVVIVSLVGMIFPLATIAQENVDAEQSNRLMGDPKEKEGKKVDTEQSTLLKDPQEIGDTSSYLFAPLPFDRSELSKAQQTAVDSIRQQPMTADIRLVQINTERLQKDVVIFNIFPEHTFTVRKQRVDKVSEDKFTWFGKLNNPTDSVILVVRGNYVTGTIRTQGELYSVKPISENIHAVIRINEDKFPPEHPPEFEKLEKQLNHSTDHLNNQSSLSELTDQVRVLKLLVAYTPAVVSKVADIDGLIQLAIDETNLSYANSKINLVAQLSHSYPVNYTESGSFDTDLQRFREPGDGIMDEVHTLRHQHSADVLILLIDNGSYCGLASAILANAKTAFAAVYHPCATGYYSFAHEMGHLQGARHNLEVDPSTSPFSFGHGYYYEPNHWRTVMSYNCPSGCTRLPYWSNPEVNYSDIPMGTADTHNNARVLNLTAATITNFESETLMGAMGFVWAHDLTASSYTPTTTYSHNSAGGEVQIYRNGKGTYRVVFNGLGGHGVAGGHVQITPYKSDSRIICRSEGWSSSGNDFIAYVGCYDVLGNPQDSRYNVLVMWP
jgi:Metallo-peptidase family M12